MKIVATILLAGLLVCVQTPVGQLLKLPLLIEHFIKHQHQDGVSLIAFLNDHYTTSHHDADLPEDEQLPFKSITLGAIGNAIVPAVIKTNAYVPLPGDKKIIFTGTYAAQQHVARIFHPPRV